MSLNKYFGLFHISTQKNRSAYCYISTKEELQVSILLFSYTVASMVGIWLRFDWLGDKLSPPGLAWDLSVFYQVQLG